MGYHFLHSLFLRNTIISRSEFLGINVEWLIVSALIATPVIIGQTYFIIDYHVYELANIRPATAPSPNVVIIIFLQTLSSCGVKCSNKPFHAPF